MNVKLITKPSINFSMLGLLVTCSIFLAATNSTLTNKTIVWKLSDTTIIGGNKPSVLGDPQIVNDNSGRSLFFDGVDDGLIIPLNPLERWKEFTLEVLFKPDTGKSVEPRMIHIQDEEGNRCTVELRLTPGGRWYLDTFLKNGKTNKGLALSDSLIQHQCGKWYWVALTYDGDKMCHYVNGVKEHDGKVVMNRMISGQTSVGLRLNKINWFKGQIREIRFHSSALKRNSLQRR
jgi:Concanavalin A-like lectin/glucanases superfamily